MKHRCTIARIGLHTAWVTVEGDRNHQVIAMPIELFKGHDPDGPRPGDTRMVRLPAWAAEVAGVTR